jgi:hypothetical protein
VKFLKIKQGAELFGNSLVPVHAIIDLGPNSNSERGRDRRRYLWLITLPEPLMRIRSSLSGYSGRTSLARELRRWYDFHDMSGGSFTLSYVEAKVYQDEGSHYGNDLLWIRPNEVAYVDELDEEQLDNDRLVTYLEEAE